VSWVRQIGPGAGSGRASTAHGGPPSDLVWQERSGLSIPVATAAAARKLLDAVTKALPSSFVAETARKQAAALKGR
jgi:hypothetical protein